eukprot:XP_001696469.1 predicted protein [Chlamydomonas reinhardtii]
MTDAWACHNCFAGATDRGMVLGCLSCARSAGSSGGWCSQVCAAKSPDGPTFSRCRACAVNSGTPWDCNTCFEKSGGSAAKRDACLDCVGARLGGWACDPRAFNEWLYRVELDWVVQRVWWLPAAYPATPLPAAAEGTGGADGATAAAALPYITYRGPEALKEAVYPRTMETPMAYSFGLVPAAGHYSYGNEREKKMPGQLCRAAGKLREALITVLGSAHLPPGLAAVDVGAAPGGWSQQLAAAGARLVVSIDPAELDPAVAALPNLVHLQCKCDQAGG